MTTLLRLALAWLLLALGTAAAGAHASLVRSAPADGSVVGSAPEQFVLTFNEPVSPLVIRLVGAGGAATPLADVTVDGPAVVVAMPHDLAAGGYALSWRVVSADGHPIAGSVVFSVGHGPAGAPPALAEDGGRPLRAAIVTVRTLAYLGLFTGIGGLFFAAFLAAPTVAATRIMVAALAVAPVALVVSLGLQGLDALGLPLARFGDGDAWRAGFATTYGTSALLALFAALLALVGLGLSGRARQAASLLTLAALGAAFASTGHASAAAPQWLTRPAVFVHAVGVAVWTGALAPLACLLLGRDETAAAPALARFSRTIPWAVLPLVAAGVALAAIQLGTPAALVATDYGLVLLAKGVLLAILLALAAVNRFRLTQPIVSGDALAARRLAAAVVAEIVLVAVILAVVALWRFTPPPRAAVPPPAPPAVAHLHADQGMAMVTVEPGRAGPVDIAVSLARMDGAPFAAREVTLTLAQPEAGIEPIRRPMTADDGIWRTDAVVLPVAGTWRIRISALVTDFDLVTFEGSAAIAP